MIKLCECGCGNPAPISKWTNRKYGHVKGKPVRFIRGHYLKNMKARGMFHHNWKGGMTRKNTGRLFVLAFNHPKKDSSGYVKNSILVVEKALGKYLPDNVVVHHVDENPSNDHNNNLIACENDNYHKFLHARMRSFKMCGHANWKKCWICKQYDNPKNLCIEKNGPIYHRKCQNEYRKILKKRGGKLRVWSPRIKEYFQEDFV